MNFNLRGQYNYLEIADYLGKKILANGIEHGDTINWLGNTHHPKKPDSMKSVVRNLNYHYYDGLLGVLFTLGYLYKETQDAKYLKTCHKIANTIETIKPDSDNMIHSLYSGFGGKMFVYFHLSTILNDEKFYSLHEKYFEKVIQSPVKSEITDIITGPIALVAHLVQMYNVSKKPEIAEFLMNVKKYIFASKIEIDKVGVAWPTMGKNPPLIGYAHGTSGFVHALLELYYFEKDESIHSLIEDVFKYEDYHFNSFYKNWPDLRLNEQGKPPGYMQAWCHGSPGIVLTRTLYDYIFKKELSPLSKEIVENLKKENTNKMNQMSSFCLCHGIAGNSEVFFLVNNLGLLNENEELKRVADFGISQYINNHLDFPSGTLNQKHTPSLMIGDSGIVHFYLRMNNRAIPSPIFNSSWTKKE